METIIRQLDRPAVQYIRKRLEAAVEPLAIELGLVINLDRCTFQTNNCRFELKVAVLDSNGEACTEDADAFRASAQLFGFEPADLGREFTVQGRSLTICGLRPKSRKYPVLAQARNGQDYKFSCQTVLDALGRKPSI